MYTDHVLIKNILIVLNIFVYLIAGILLVQWWKSKDVAVQQWERDYAARGTDMGETRETYTPDSKILNELLKEQEAPITSHKIISAKVTVEDVINLEVDTTDWLTHQNEEYGYAFRYPEDWLPTEGLFIDMLLYKADKKTGEIWIGEKHSSRTGFAIHIKNISELLSLTPPVTVTELKETLWSHGKRWTSEDEHSFTVNGQPAWLIRRLHGGTHSMDVFIIGATAVYNISLSPPEALFDGYTLRDLETFIGIYRTFEILE